MKLLLDSHVFLWLLFDPDRVKPRVREAIGAAESVSLSIVSLWELALKHTEGKLPHEPDKLNAGAEALNLFIQSVRPAHIEQLPGIKLEHQDPFDQMLIAQSHVDQLILVTADNLLLMSDYATIDAR